MLSKFIPLIFIILLSANHEAHANQAKAPLNKYFSPVKSVGETRFKYLWLDVYDVALFTNDGEYQPNRSFALEIVYLMEFDSNAIVKRTIKEISDQGFTDSEKLKHWEMNLKGLFPNVKKGDSIIGIKDDAGASHFYFNGKALGSIDDKEFSQRFFNIWLGPESKSPKHTNKLINKQL